MGDLGCKDFYKYYFQGGKKMKKRITKTLLAVTLCTAMAGTPCFVAGATTADKDAVTSGSATGDATVTSPKYKFAVPTDLTFAIDPFKQGGQSQIYSEEFMMINKSNLPIRMDCTVKLSGASSGVTIKEKEEEVTETGTDKLVYVAAEIAKSVNEFPEGAAAYATSLGKAGTDYYLNSLATDLAGLSTPVTITEVTDEMVDVKSLKGDYDANSVKVGLNASTEGVKLGFALAGATYQEYYTAKDKSTKDSQFKTVAANGAGSASFRFTGKVNSKAQWTNGTDKFTATVTYSVIGLSPENYTALTANANANAHAYVVESQAPTFSASTDALTIAYTEGVGSAGLKSIDSVTAFWDIDYDIYNASSSPEWVAATKSNGKIVFANDPDITIFATAPDATEDGKLDVTVNYTTNDDVQHTETVSVLFKVD